ncbi:MAG: (Fe-S)-binding protein [Spirochaetes bacterium]|nr:(Fe-S)-binding protein [Spirochaetota bacterium]
MKDLKELKKIEQYADSCIKCGFCTFFCPVYQEDKIETNVARGKNFLIRQILKGEQKFTKEMQDILGRCLLCKRCWFICPPKTQIDRVVMAARAQKVNEKGMGFIKRLIFSKLMSHRKLFGLFAKIVQKFQWIMPRTEGNVRHVPDFVKVMGRRNFPEFAKKFMRDRVKPVYESADGKPAKIRVGFFMGCLIDFMYPDLGLKAIEFLTRHGVEVVVPKDQNCCGIPMSTNGDFKTARMLANKNIEAFEKLNVDYIVSICATCSSGLKDYQKYLPENEEQKKRYEAFEKKIKDINEFIFDNLKIKPEDLTLKKEFQGKTATWHDPCHLVRYQNIKDQPRAILKGLNGLKYAEMPNADLCCGMGGSFSVYHYDITKKIGAKKMNGVKATGADIVVTACPGCMMSLEDSAIQNNMPQKVYHILELVE